MSTKGQLDPEWIHEIIVSLNVPTKDYKDFFPGNLLEGRAEILVVFGWHFGRNDDLMNSFWIFLTFTKWHDNDVAFYLLLIMSWNKIAYSTVE